MNFSFIFNKKAKIRNKLLKKANHISLSIYQLRELERKINKPFIPEEYKNLYLSIINDNTEIINHGLKQIKDELNKFFNKAENKTLSYSEALLLLNTDKEYLQYKLITNENTNSTNPKTIDKKHHDFLKKINNYLILLNKNEIQKRIITEGEVPKFFLNINNRWDILLKAYKEKIINEIDKKLDFFETRLFFTKSFKKYKKNINNIYFMKDFIKLILIIEDHFNQFSNNDLMKFNIIDISKLNFKIKNNKVLNILEEINKDKDNNIIIAGNLCGKGISEWKKIKISFNL